MDEHLLLIRGLPGAGKSTLARKYVLAGYCLFEADQYFISPDGVYCFDGTALREAHAQCLRNTKAALEMGQRVVVANTFSRHRELAPYMNLGPCMVIDLFDAGLSDEALAARTIHNVPLGTIRAMRARWQR